MALKLIFSTAFNFSQRKYSANKRFQP